MGLQISLDMNKICKRCNLSKNTSEFYRDTARVSGLNDWCKQCKKDWLVEYRAVNSERILAQQREYKSLNKAAVLEGTRTYKYTHPDRIRDHNANRRAWRKDQFVEDVSRVIVFERDGGICHICLDLVDPNDWHLDHVIPLSKGGLHSYGNTAVSHPFCNESKNDKTGFILEVNLKFPDLGEIQWQ